MKPNDMIVCEKDFFNILLSYPTFIEGKSYRICDIVNDRMWIIDDDGDNEYFFIDKIHKNYIEWFYSQEEIRLLKLNSI